MKRNGGQTMMKPNPARNSSSRWTLSRRLTVAFAAILALLLIWSATISVILNTISSKAIETAKHHLPTAVAVEDVAQTVHQIQEIVLSHMLASDLATKQQLEQQAAMSKEAIAAKLKEVESRLESQQDREMLNRITAARDEYVRIRSSLFELSRAGKTDEALSLNKAQLEPAMERYLQAIAALGKDTREELASAATSTELSSKYGLRIAVLGALAAVIAAGFVGWYTNRAVTRLLRSVVAGLQDNSEQVAAAAGQVTSTGQSLAQGASEQAASLEETSASLEELAAMTQRNAANAQQARTLASQTRTAVEGGQGEMTQLTRAMDDIQTASTEISKIIKTIDEIAFQTNLLALNAAVEAARAGEAGMGFAVVADEVRALAQRAAAAARETAEKIENSVAKSQAGASISQRVAQQLQDILAKARQVDELVAEIAAASQEQSQGIGQINSAVGQMDKVTQANAAAAEESAAAARELQSQADALRGAVMQLQALMGGEVSRAETEQPAASIESTFTKVVPVKRRQAAGGVRATSIHRNGWEGDLGRQVDKAMAAHNAWKQRLLDAIRTGHSEHDPAKVSTDNQCDFGKWLYSMPHELQRSEDWQKVRALHAEFHKEAGRVLELALAGRQAEARQSLEHGGEYARRSAALIEAMIRWKKGSGTVPPAPAVARSAPTTVTSDDLAGSFVDNPIPMPPPQENPTPRFHIAP
jgi:methyl-accepting chemotaxis protein